MPRYGAIIEPDTAPVDEGDAVFLGVDQDEDTSPELLASGMVSDAVNKRARNGTARTRPGMLTPTPFNMSTDAIVGSGRFSDPNGKEWVLLARSSRVDLVRWDTTPFSLTLPAGETLAADIEFEQALDRVLMFRGEDKAVLVWNPAAGSAFDYLDEPSPTKTQLPKAQDGEMYKNSVWVPFAGDWVAMSDVLSYYQYDPVENLFLVNAGEDDKITRIFPYLQNTLLVFKNQSTYIFTDIYPNATTGKVKDSIRLETVNPQIGCIARKTPTMIGSDVYFLSEGGVRMLSRNTEGLLREDQQFVSDPMRRTMREINWPYAGKAVAIAHREYWYLALPKRPSTVNNVVLVLNVRTGRWEGYDTFPTGVQIDNLILSDWQGKKEVFAINNATGAVYLMYMGEEDRIYDTANPISDLFDTRAYLLRDNEIKAIRRVRVNLRTYDAKVSVDVIEDGVNEVVNVASDVTLDRTRYDVWGKPKYDATNANDDHATPRRQDYSAPLDYWLKSGIEAPLAQSKIFSYETRSQTRFVRVRVRNTHGTCEVASIGVEGFNTQRYLRTKG